MNTEREHWSLYECEKGTRWGGSKAKLGPDEDGVCIFSGCGDGKHTYQTVGQWNTPPVEWFRAPKKRRIK